MGAVCDVIGEWLKDARRPVSVERGGSVALIYKGWAKVKSEC
jgi:hypothetical protein